MPHIWLDHSIVGQPEELEIRRDRSFTFCRICGAVFQPAVNRLPDHEYDALAYLQGTVAEKAWSANHNRKHSDMEHRLLAASGRFVTPEAAYRLVPYGIVPLVQDDEVAHASQTAPRCPTDSPLTTLRDGSVGS